LAFDSDLAPIVGQQVTLTSTNGGAVGPRIDLMIARAGTAFTSLMLGGNVTECDVIVKGSVGGVERGWYLDGADFSDDVGGTISDASLRLLAASEGPLTYTAVPPGSGYRAGIDRDEDWLLNGVETNTGVFVDENDTGTDPALRDTDGDGFDDGFEVVRGTDPTDPLSFPGPSVPSMGPWGRVVAVGLMVGLGLALAHRRRLAVS
jgi:hypothetical protein